MSHSDMLLMLISPLKSDRYLISAFSPAQTLQTQTTSIGLAISPGKKISQTTEVNNFLQKDAKEDTIVLYIILKSFFRGEQNIICFLRL